MVKVHSLRSYRSCSPSSLSSSLSLTSTDSSSLTDSSSVIARKVRLALRLLASSCRTGTGRERAAPEGDPGRCSWITKQSEEVYVKFHDECWGVPVFDDSKLFELLTMCGMLMDFNWTHILSRAHLLRSAFAEFDPLAVSQMGEKEIAAVSNTKGVSLAGARVRCIVENAKCVAKVVEEFGSFSDYVRGVVGHKPVVNRFRHQREVPLRSPKAELLSRELRRRGFRLVGPVIVYSFMQAAGMTVDHLAGCFRYPECVRLAQDPWLHPYS